MDKLTPLLGGVLAALVYAFLIDAFAVGIVGGLMKWRDWRYWFRIVVGVGLGGFGISMWGQQGSPIAIWALMMGGFILAHVMIWDPIVSWMAKGQEIEPLQKTWIETIRTMIGWLFTSSSIIIGFIVTTPHRPTSPGVLLLSKVGVAVLAAGIFFGVFHITLLVTSLNDKNGHVEIKRKIVAASTVLLHLTFWGLLGGLLAVVVSFMNQ